MDFSSCLSCGGILLLLAFSRLRFFDGVFCSCQHTGSWRFPCPGHRGAERVCSGTVLSWLPVQPLLRVPGIPGHLLSEVITAGYRPAVKPPFPASGGLGLSLLGVF